MRLICVTVPIVLWLVFPGLLAADQELSKVEKAVGAVDLRGLLKTGQASGGLPDGMVVRISACLGESDVKASGDQVLYELHETWEFTSNQVHRVFFEDNTEKKESRPFDSKDLCKDLLEGQAIEIQAKQGKGPEVAFVGTRYHRGSRNIEVVWNGNTILALAETNGPFLNLYRESDARAFGALYERLASQARAAFKPKTAPQK